MKVVRFNPLSLCKIFTFIFGLFKRAMCFLQRRRRNSDSLPISMNSIQTGNSTQHDIPANEPSDLQDWSDWGSGDGPISVMVDGGQEEHNEVDFFTDMAPKIKKPVLIRKKVATDNNTPSAMSNRLAMDAGVATQSVGELGTWEDNEVNAWEDESAGSSISTWEVEQAIKEKKQQERERRAMEQQRKKMERESQRALKKDGGKLAMKLS